MKKDSEIIRNIERRTERLEREAGMSQGISMIEEMRKYLLDYEIPILEEKREEGREDEKYSKLVMVVNIGRLERDLITLILGKIETQLNHIEAKTKKERLILNRLAPNHFTFNFEGSMYQEIRNPDHDVWKNHELFIILERFKNRVETGRYLHKLGEMTNHFFDDAVEACREIGI